MALVAGTYGLLLRIDLGEDVSGNTGLALSIINPRVETVIRTPVLGAVEVVDCGVTLPAYTYVEYVTVADDFPLAGRYTLQVEVDFGAVKALRTVSNMIEVLP
jgi:hypothetical protein